MAEELNKIFAQIQAYDADPKANKVSLPRKRESIYQVQKLLKKLQGRAMIAIQAHVVTFVFTLAKHGAGASMVRAMIDLIRWLYQNGGDFTKMMTEFFEPAIGLITNAKTSSQVRFVMIQMTGKIFKTLWMRCANPPTKELFEAYTSLKQKNHEKYIREAAYKALKDVIKVNPSNLFQIQNDLLKHLLKQVKEEKSNQIKVQVVQCLGVFIKDTMNNTNMHNSFELLFTVCTKGFEEQDPDVQYQYVLCCAYLLNMRLQESQQVGDIKTDFKTYNQQQLDGMEKKQRKSAAILNVPRTVSDMLAMFGTMLITASQAGQQNANFAPTASNMRNAISQVICLVASANVSHLEATDVEVLMNTLLLSIQNCKEDPLESQRQRLTVVWIIGHYVQCMELEQRTLLLKHCLKCLQTRQLHVKKETLDMMTGFGKQLKISTMINEGQHMALLQVANEVLFEFDATDLHTKFNSEREIVDAILPYMGEPNPYQVRRCAVEVFKTLGAKSSNWIHSLISTFMSSVSIANADIMSGKQVFIYAQDGKTDPQQAARLLDSVKTLDCHATALACLFQSVPNAIKGVPVALVSTAMHSVKSLILGGQPLEPKTDEQKAQLALSKVNPLQSSRREAGWIILQGFLYLGKDWIKSELPTILKLFKSVFRKETCQIEHGKLKEPIYQETVLREFIIKAQAVKALKTLLQEFDTLSEQAREIKSVSTFACHAATFFMDTSEKSTCEKLFVEKFSQHQVAQAKSDLFACLLQLSPELFSTKFVTLLHPVVAIIISQEGGTNKIPSICKELLNEQDSFIVPSFPLVTVNEKDKKAKPIHTDYKDIPVKSKVHKNLLEKRFELFENLTIQSQNQIELDRPLLELCKPQSQLDPHFGTKKGQSIQPRQQLLCNAIRLFSHIFTSEQLNEKNKNQLLKHFTVHVQPSAPTPSTDKKDKKDKEKDEPQLPIYRPEKITKLIRIAITMLLVAKKASESTEDNNSKVCLGDQQYAMILAVLSSLELARNDFLIRIVAETYTYLHAEYILTNQEQTLELIIAELEKDSAPLAAGTKLNKLQESARIVKLQRAAAICGNLMRNFDYDTLLAPIEDRMNTVIMNVLRENDLAVRRFGLHFASIMAEHGPCSDKYFDQVFQSSFHFIQTDIKPDFHAVASLARLCNTQLLKGDPRTTQQWPRILIVQNEIVDILLLNEPKQREKEILIEGLNTLKVDILLQNRIIQERSQHVIELLLRMLSSKDLTHMKTKVKVLEVLSALVYKGYYAKIQTLSKNQFNCILLDQLNESLRVTTKYKDSGSNEVNIVKALSSNEDFERLINYSNEYNLEELQDDEVARSRPTAVHSVYQRCLKLLYLLVFKMSALTDFVQTIQFTKTVLNYRHTTPLQKLEKVLQDGPAAGPAGQGEGGVESFVFSYQPSDFVRCFLMEAFKDYVELFCTVDTENRTDIRSQASTLISLAFATLSQESTNLKSVGFSLIICLVDLFSQCFEKIADDEDEEEEALRKLGAQGLKVKTFLENPLLLEQDEARIYSIIKQHLNKGGSQSVPPEIVAKNFELIQLFITVPICKDETILAKLFDLLMDGMAKSTQLLGAQMHSHEAMITETHFKKLILLCKLVMQAQHGLDPIQEGQQSSIERIHQKDKTLPSKFQAADRERLLQVVKAPGRGRALVTHLVAALNDALVLSLQTKGDQRKYKFITPGCCPQNSPEAEVIRGSVQYCLEGISILMQLGEGVELEQADWSVVTLSLFLGLSAGVRNNNFDDDSIRGYIRGKMHDLVLVKRFLQADLPGGAFRSSPLELSELCNILLQLPKLGVAEINELVLQIVQLILDKDFFGMFNGAMAAQMAERFLGLSTGLLLQVQPEFKEAKTESQQYSAFGEKQLDAAPQPVAPDVKLAQVKSAMATLHQLFKYQTSPSRGNMSPEDVKLLKATLAQCIAKVVVNLDKLPDTDEAKRFYILQIAQLTQHQWAQPQVRDQTLTPVLVASTHALAKRTKSEGQALSNYSAALLHNLIQTACQTADAQLQTQMRQALNALLFGDPQHGFSPTLRAYLPVMQRGLPPGPLSQHLIGQLFVALFKELQGAQPDEMQVLAALTLISQFYKVQNGLATESRARLLQPLFATLFTVMNAQALSPQTRNATVEHVYQVFTADQDAFKQFAGVDPATGQSWLTPQEKDVITKVIQKYQAMQASTQQTSAAAAQDQAAAAQKQASTRQPLASATGNKIKLGFNFKKK